MAEVKGLLSNFNCQQYSIVDFMVEVFQLFDKVSVSSFEIVEYILG